ncbi:MAG: RHS repeat-associated core domain-containing protein [Owenweeksia sp.]
MPGRTFNGGDYRYGFNGQEQDDEIKGTGNSVNFKFRVHDPRLGRFLSIDPLAANYPWNSPYAFAENKVIQFIELEGAEVSVPAYVHENGYSTAIDRVGAQSISDQTIQQRILVMKEGEAWKQAAMIEKANNNQATISDYSFGPQQDQFEVFSHNFNNGAEMLVPGYEIMGKLGRGEEITKFDIGIEVASIIPVGKVFGRVGKVLANSEFAEAGVRELTTFIKNNAGETAETVLKRLDKSVAKHERRIAEHKSYIADPKTKYGDDWDSFTDQRKANEIHHWKQDIKRHEAYRDSKKAAAEEIRENQ